jgi:hypothetical protein
MDEKQLDHINAHCTNKDLEAGRYVLCQCAWCKRFCIDGVWKTYNPPEGHAISHGACPECKVRIINEAQANNSI